jgi:uncharacterized protein (DUF1778 family)
MTTKEPDMATRASSRGSDSRRITAEIPGRVRARIEEAAAWKGVSVDRFLVEAAAKEAEQVIEKERLFQLSREDAELMLTLLETPPTPNAALRKAMQTRKRLLRGRD